MTIEQLNAKIDELWTKTKAGLLPRDRRFSAVEALTDEYMIANDGALKAGQSGGKSNQARDKVAQSLDRLATLCLYEEMSDQKKNKMQTEDAPFMSDSQYLRRKSGRHQRKDSGREVAFEAAHTVGIDGRNYRMPVRKTV